MKQEKRKIIIYFLVLLLFYCYIKDINIHRSPSRKDSKMDKSTIKATINEATRNISYLRGRRDSLNSMIEEMKKQVLSFTAEIESNVEKISDLDDQLVALSCQEKI